MQFHPHLNQTFKYITCFLPRQAIVLLKSIAKRGTYPNQKNINHEEEGFRILFSELECSRTQ